MIVGASRHAVMAWLQSDEVILVLIAHQRAGIKGCTCGWAEPGRLHSRHVAGKLAELLNATPTNCNPQPDRSDQPDDLRGVVSDPLISAEEAGNPQADRSDHPDDVREWAEYHAPYDRVVTTLVRALRADGFVQ